MSIFRRGRKAEHPDADDSTTDVVADEVAEAEAPEDETTPAPVADDFDRTEGPLDATEVPGVEDRLDLGSLWFSARSDLSLQLQVDPEEQIVTSVVAVLDDSSVQLQAFAAPKTAGLWAEIREEIAASIVKQGGTVEERPGVLGIELRTRMPQAGPGGRTVFAPARFAGVDGPRWFLRAVFSGKAAIDELAAKPLFDVVRDVVVVRGDAPMAPREMLPLQLPEATAVEPDEAEPAADETPTRASDLNPFERGPEITEVR